MKTNKILSKTRLALAVSSFLSMSVMSPNSLAQSESGDVVTLEVLVVTAAKRTQTLQNTPIAVSVVTQEEIDKAEIKDAFDLQATVPSLRVSQGGSTANSGFAIRGFGGAASNAGIEPSVGVFIDGVYRSRASAQISDLSNIERVEVLRGPQSTLFGKNASVGVVSILTREPQFDRETDLSATLGDNSTFRLNVNNTGPLTDNLAYRVTANINQRDGFATNLKTGSDVNNRDRWGVQGQLLYVPNDDFKVRIIADYDEIDESCCLTSNIVSGPTTDFVVGALGSFVDEDPFSYHGFTDFDPVNRIENVGVSLQIDKALNFADFTSITSLRSNESFTFNDADATSADLISSLNLGDVETFTQEFRLASGSSDSDISWLIGASYFDESIENPGEFLVGNDFRAFANGLSGNGLTLAEAALGLPIGSTFGLPGQGPIEQRGQDNQSFSVFANLDWSISDQLTATLGLSYIDDEKEAFLSQVNTDVFSSLDFVALGFASALGSLGVNPRDPAAIGAFAAANPAAFAAVQAGAQNPASNPLLGLRALQFNPPFLDFPNSVENGRSEDDKVTYNLRLAYNMSDNLSVYGSYSTGFKATSFNLSRNSRPSPTDFIPGSPVTSPASSPIRDAGLAVANLTTGTRFAAPEETDVFELGLKVQYRNFNVNVAVFDQVVKDFQSNIFTGVGFALSNAGEQSTRGVEIDGRWAVNDALTVSFGGSFYDPKFDSFVNSPSGDLTGERPAGVSRTSTSLAFNYDFQISGLDSFVRVDWQHSSATNYSDNPTFQQLIGFQREFDLVNASAGVTLASDTSIKLWARNILDEQYITAAFPSVAQSGSVSGFANQPISYGITIRQRF